jgi:hypothetical protein
MNAKPKTMKKRKISSIEDLHLEQARLRMEVKQSEKAISDRMEYLRKNYPSILLMQVLPFEDSKKDMIVNGLGFAISLMMGRIAETGKELLEKNLQKLLQWISSKFGSKSDAESSNAG